MSLRLYYPLTKGVQSWVFSPIRAGCPADHKKIAPEMAPRLFCVRGWLVVLAVVRYSFFDLSTLGFLENLSSFSTDLFVPIAEVGTSNV